MSIERPRTDAEIYVSATKGYNGLLADGSGVPVTMVTATQMLTSRDAFKNAGTNYNSARNARGAAYKVFEPAMQALYTWLVTVRAVLARRLGPRWTEAWAEPGFLQPSTRVPRTIDGRISLGVSLKEYYTAHPEYEVPDMEITALAAQALSETAVTTQNVALGADQVVEAADATRQTARTAVLGNIEALIANLEQKLGPDDPRWTAFGFRKPSTPTTPPKVTGLHVTMMDGIALAECDPAPLATRYRFRSRIVGIEPKYKLAASEVAPMAKLEDLPVGVQIELIVQAVNGPSQSVASDPITFSVLPPVAAPAPAAKPAISESELAPLTAISPNGSSNGNGHGSHAVSRLG